MSEPVEDLASMFEASHACNTAVLSAEFQPLELTTQTMPFLLPFAETAGVAALSSNLKLLAAFGVSFPLITSKSRSESPSLNTYT